MNGTQTEKVSADWLTDTRECWERLPNKLFFFGLLAAWLALFQFWGNSILGYVHTSSLFGWLDEAYNSPGNVEDAGHGDFIPFLVIGVFWWKRKELLALPLKIWPPAIFIFVAGILLHIAGYMIQQPLFSVVALFVGIYGLMGLAWGREWLRHSHYPFLLFIFSIPLASHLNFILFPLRLFVCVLVEWAARLVGIDVIRHGTQLFDPSGKFQYEVAAACGGMRSLVAIILIATVYAFVIFKSPKKRILLMASAIPFAVLGNFVRLSAIILAASIGGQSAGNYVHEGGPLGIISLLPYVPAIFGLLWLGNFMEKRELRERKNEK
ncbi:MAG TPA: exosortase/archaeosortase family protein [Verrucomicrobiae bacterium]|nr:exosortase/archaeosortase family protein [Verrucomicrobiae bacterium]